MAIIEAAVQPTGPVDVDEVLAEVRKLGLRTPTKQPPGFAPPAMPVKVVDASAVASVLFAEPGADAVAARIADARLVAPALLHFELANVCLMKIRRHPEQREALLQAYRLLVQLRMESVDVDHAGVLALAETTGLTGYDASYLWLARELGAELVTLDRRLAAAAV